MLGRLGKHCGPTRITLWPHGLLYIERRFCKLYHPRIVHSCNVLRLPPRSGLFLRHWYLFSSIFGVGFTTFGIKALDSRVSLLQTGHREIFAINLFLQMFKRWNLGACKNPNFHRSYLRKYCEPRSELFTKISSGFLRNGFFFSV